MLFATLDNNVHLPQKSCVHFSIYLRNKSSGTLNSADNNTTPGNALTPYHKSLVSVDNVEETAEQVPGDVQKREDDDVPDFHEPRAVEAAPLLHHDEEVEAD